MNNILTFEDYKKMNIRQVESVIYRQFVETIIKNDEEKVNEGIIRNFINKRSSKFIQAALGDEIEKGKELEKSIKEALDGLNKGFEEVEKNIDANAKEKPNIDAIEKVKEAIKKVQSQAFDTLTMIGSEGEIDFAGFMGSASVAAAANFGILFSPIRSVFITRKAYKYFLGIIKQTIRRNLLVIQLNFDQFENLILQKSFESQEDSEFFTKITTLDHVMNDLTEQLCGEKTKFLKPGKNKELKDKIEVIRKNTEQAFKQHKISSQNNPFSSLWQDQHNNTYTRTLEQIKQYINEDSQKELDALKNSITKMAGSDVELVQYGELLISAAEEYAIKTNHGINNNFIKMSSVFNLENQKKLIQLITDAQKEAQEESEKKYKENVKDIQEEENDDIETGRRIYEELKDSIEELTFDSFNEKYSKDEIKAFKIFLVKTDEGKDAYKELVNKNPLFKYIISHPSALGILFECICNLDVVEISNAEDFYDNIIKEDQALYYMMANTSIKDAIEGNDSKDYFGFDIPSERVKDNILQDEPIEESIAFATINEGAAKLKQVERNKEAIEKLTNQLQDQQKTIDKLLQKEQETDEERKKLAEDRKNLQELIDKYTKLLKDTEIDNKEKYKKVIDDAEEEIENTEEYVDSDDDSKKPSGIDDILTKKLFPNDKTKKYFLTFDGEGNKLFDILHKDFKSEIFTGDTYVSDISIDNKLTIFKIIHELFNIGKDVAKQLAKYLVGLEAHMLLDNKDSWFVVKNNTELIEKEKCFIKDSDKIRNENAFVEINQDEYNDIKKFLETLHKNFSNMKDEDINEE